MQPPAGAAALRSALHIRCWWLWHGQVIQVRVVTACVRTCRQRSASGSSARWAARSREAAAPRPPGPPSSPPAKGRCASALDGLPSFHRPCRASNIASKTLICNPTSASSIWRAAWSFASVHSSSSRCFQGGIAFQSQLACRCQSDGCIWVGVLYHACMHACRRQSQMVINVQARP